MQRILTVGLVHCSVSALSSPGTRNLLQHEALPLPFVCVCVRVCLQVDGGGGLVCWGGDIAGGTNLSLLVSPSDKAPGGLTLVLEPAEAAGGSHVCVCQRGWLQDTRGRSSHDGAHVS